MFPCPDRYRWYAIRDEIYLDVMNNCWNAERGFFTQSIESQDALDSSVLIMPLVFFSSPCDPRLLSTITQMLRPPEKGMFMSQREVWILVLPAKSLLSLRHFLRWSCR
jgi:GH15 family glucan-1,4-alpha-glucosidase